MRQSKPSSAARWLHSERSPAVRCELQLRNNARVRVIRAQRATLVQWEHEQDHFDKLTARIAQSQAVTPATILAEFAVI